MHCFGYFFFWFTICREMSMRRRPRALRPGYRPQCVAAGPSSSLPSVFEKLLQVVGGSANRETVLELQKVESLDLGDRLQWLFSPATDLSAISFSNLKALVLPVYNGSVNLPPCVPRHWYANLQSFTVVVHLEEEEEEDDEEEEEEEEHNDTSVSGCAASASVAAFAILPPTVTEFAVLFAHRFFDACCIARLHRNRKSNCAVFPFQLATIFDADFSVLLQSPQTVQTVEFGLAGRKPLIDVFQTMRSHSETVKKTLFYKYSGLQSIESKWIPRFASLARLRTHNLTAIDATSLLLCLDEALCKHRGAMQELTLEMNGTECDLMRSPTRYSQPLIENQLALRRRGFRTFLQIDDDLKPMLEVNQKHVQPGGRLEDEDSRKDRVRRERERIRIGAMFETDYGTLDGACAPLESQERIYRRWVPRLLRRDRALLLEQKFHSADQQSIVLFAMAWKRWREMATALACYLPDVPVAEQMSKLAYASRVICVANEPRIVAVWYRDTLFNEMNGNRLKNNILANFEYLCGLNMQVDPMSIADAEVAPIVPNNRDVEFRRREIQFHTSEKKEELTDDRNGMAAPKKRAMLIEGVVTMGLRIQRPSLSIGCATNSAHDTSFYRTYCELFYFATQNKK